MNMEKELIIVVVLMAAIFGIIWLWVYLSDRKERKRFQKNV